jgi:NitT/TauT family transport system substrate-binding protein
MIACIVPVRGGRAPALAASLALLLAVACAPTASAPAAPGARPPSGAAEPARSASASAAPAGEPQPVTITLDWIGYQPHHMAFWLAKERGWYRDRGLDVTIQDARGSGQVVQLLTAGQTDFGLVTGIAHTQAVAKGAPLQTIGVFTQKDNTALKYFLSSGIRTPKDLEGRTVGLVAGSVQALVWPNFAEAAGFDSGRVSLINVDIQTYNRAFAANQFDATNALVGSTDDLTYDAQGTPIGRFVFSDYLPMIGHGIDVTTKTLADRPVVAEAFARGTQQAWDYLLKNPRDGVQQATDVIVQNVDGAPPANLLIEGALQVIPDMMRAKSTEGKPVGWSSPDDWRGMAAALQKSADLPRAPTAEELVTNRFME